VGKNNQSPFIFYAG